MNRKGQATVEFALTALVLFLVLFALIDFSIMFFVNLTMQHAVREGARYAVTGQGKNGADRRKNMVDKISDSSYGLYEKNAGSRKDPEIRLISYPDSGAFSNYTGSEIHGDTGEPSQVIMVQLAYSWPLLTPIIRPFFDNGQYSFVVRTTMKHEPWEDK